MKLMSRRSHALGPAEGSTVDGYLVESVRGGRTGGELVCDVLDPDGFPATLVIGLDAPAGRSTGALTRRWTRLRAGLHHPALVPVHAAGEHSGRPYLAAERYPAETLGDLLERAPLAPEEILPRLASACDALDLAHGAGLVHQRLTCESLLVGDDAELVLDTFGIPGGPPRDTLAGSGARDVRYTAPEELRGERLAPASNIYSLACLLVHALTGSAPFEGSLFAQAHGHLESPPPQASERVPALGRDLDRVIEWAMAKEPARRPRSARALLSKTAAALGVTLPAPTVRLPEMAPAVTKRGRRSSRAARTRRRRLTALGAVILAGLVAGAIVAPFGAGEPAGADRDAAALERLDRSRTTLRAQLAAEETPAAQADAAAGLAAAYRRVAAGAESPRLADAAHAAEQAYFALSAAARAGSGESYSAASEAVDRAERRVGAAARSR
jgi:serine/threonine-protein kinase